MTDNTWILKDIGGTNAEYTICKNYTTVGRNINLDLKCTHPGVSRSVHAVIVLEEGNLYVKPSKSLNGTWLNGKRLQALKLTQLFDGNNISFGLSGHPADCNKKESDSYSYTVMLHTPPSNLELLRILKGEDEDEDEVTQDSGVSQNNFLVVSEDEMAVEDNPEINSKPAKHPITDDCIVIDSDDDLTIKDEPKDPPEIVEYSIVDDCIVIDNDDDFEIASSQMFDKANLTQTDDIDCEDIHFENSRITSPDISSDDEASDDNALSIGDTSDKDENDNINVKSDEGKNNIIGEKKDQVVAPETLTVSINGQIANREKGIEIPKKTVVDRSFLVQSKYHKPEIIPPHTTVNSNTMKKRRKSLSNEDQNIKKQKMTSDFKENENNHKLPNENNVHNKKTPNSLINKHKKIIKNNQTHNIPIPKELPSNNILCETLYKPQPPRMKDPRMKNKSEGNLAISNKQIVNDNDLEGLLRCSVNRSVNPQPVDVRRKFTVFSKPSRNLVLAMLTWNTRWLCEQQIQSKPPPIIRKDVVKMCTYFETHQNYCNVVKPFLALELWDMLSHAYKVNLQSDAKKFRISIKEVMKFADYQILDCICYGTNRTDGQQAKDGEVILISLGLRPQNNGKQALIKVMFAYVITSNTRWLKSTDMVYADLLSNTYGIPMEIHFRLLLKPFPEEILIAKFADAMTITSITTLVREYDAVTYMCKSPIAQLIFNPKTDNFIVPQNSKLYINKMNLSSKQVEAIFNACSLCVGNKPGLYLIQGPPGTGKTTVVQHIIQNLLRINRNIRILVVAPSNATVDCVARKVAREDKVRNSKKPKNHNKLKMVRLGIYKSVSADLQHYFIDEIAKKQLIEQFLRERPEVGMDYESLITRKNKLTEQIGKYEKSDLQKADKLSRELKVVEGLLSNFARDYCADNYYQEKLERAKKHVVMNANIVFTTLNSCIRLENSGIKFDCCIVDEAGQSKETETIIPLSLGIEKMVMIGDPQQLPAVTLSKFAKDLKYGQSLFSRIRTACTHLKKDPITMLNMQYRMDPELCLYPNEKFYGGQLKTADACKLRGGLEKLMPYYVFNLNLLKKAPNNYTNANEVACVANLLTAIQRITGHKLDKKYSVGVITVYNSQKEELKKQIKLLQLPTMDITVNTVDSFQGIEKDIIIISCVRTVANSFLDDEQRLNVALTRGRRVLYVIGSNPVFDHGHVLKSLKNNAQSRNLYLNIHDIRMSVLKSVIEKTIQ